MEVIDKNNNTLFIEFSKDGSYWNVNNGGIFRNSYSKKKDIIWTLPTIGNNSSIEVVGVNHGTTKDATVTSEDSPQTISSFDKNKEVADNKQETSAKKDENTISTAESQVNTEPTDAQKKACNYKMRHVKVDGYDITVEK